MFATVFLAAASFSHLALAATCTTTVTQPALPTPDASCQFKSCEQTCIGDGFVTVPCGCDEDTFDVVTATVTEEACPTATATGNQGCITPPCSLGWAVVPATTDCPSSLS